MVLQRIFFTSLVLSVVGSLAALVFAELKDAIWFAVGSVAALMNFAVALVFIRSGLQNIRKKFILVALVLFKSFAFISILAMLLVFLKPALLPFTLGVGIVMVGSLFWAIWESRKFILKGSFE